MKELLRIVHGMQDETENDILHDYNLEVYEGDILYIQGAVGSGIRTLARIFAGDVMLKAGRLFLNGREVQDYNRNSAYQYQIYTITAERDLVEAMTVAENLEGVRYLPFAGARYSSRKAEQAVTAYLEKEQVQVGAGEYVWTLSQKERKKLSILKAKMHGARLIILDATHGFYEGREAEELCELICRANEEGITFVILSRHYTVFAEIANRIHIISKGIDLKEWGRINDRVRCRLRDPLGVQRREPSFSENRIETKKGKPERRFLGLYDYEWEMEDGLWQYLSFVREQNPDIWDREIKAHIPAPGSSFCRDTVLIPQNSGECLVEKLSIVENLILPIPLRVGRSRAGIIRQNICRNIAENFYRTTGIEPDKTRIADLDRIERKILSICRWEMEHPKFMILESPYSGMNAEEVFRLRTYLQRMADRGIRILYFSRSLDEMERDCERVFLTQNGRSAKIATLSHFFPPHESVPG